MAVLSAGAHVGPYEIIAPLRGGGMATLWLARRVGPAGFSRPVAIKVIHEHLAEDPAFVEMFLDEARLAAQIAHPNVVRVEELGQHERTYFMAMEWIRGAALSSLMAGLQRQRRALSPPLACAIAMEVAEGLHAAHEARDDHGAPLDVIHRDVSPQNILISVSGHVKLIDFGVAKARGRKQQSEAGELRGKLRYMAPEQAWGRPIDRRADIYALGVVLWELLTRSKLFQGDSEIELLEMVRHPSVTPPHQLDADVSEALSEVVMTALAPEANERYQSAQAFRRALANACPEASRIEPDAIAALLASVAQSELDEQSQLISNVTGADLSLPQPRASEEALTQLTRPMRESSVPTQSRAGARASSPPMIRGTQPPPEPIAPPTSAPGNGTHEFKLSKLAVFAGAAALVLLGMGGAALYKQSTRGRAAPAATVSAADAATDAPSGVCANARRIELAASGAQSLSFDTRGLPAGRFPFGIMRRADAPNAPDVVLQVHVGGSGPRALDVSTVNTGTDVRYDTTLGIYRGACDESMVQRRADYSFDDEGAAREFRAQGSIVAQGGEWLTVVLTGFGGEIAGRVDRGLAQLDLRTHDTHPPTLQSASALVAGQSVVIDTRGEDIDRDIVGVRVQLIDGQSAALDHGDGGASATLAFDHPVEGLRSIQERLLIPMPESIDLTRAQTARVSLVDRPGNSSATIDAPVVRGAIVREGMRCDSTHVCATELVCNGRSLCQATSDRVSACDLAPALEWAFDAQGVGRIERSAMILGGTGLFTGMCMREATRGREDIVRVRVPRGRWRMVLTTDAPLQPGESAMEPDTILYVRKRCTDTSESSAPLSACIDDIAPGHNQRSRLELTVTEPTEYFVFVELWGGSLNDARGEPYWLGMELHPL